jgi:hypothetical protein
VARCVGISLLGADCPRPVAQRQTINAKTADWKVTLMLIINLS